MCNSLDEMYHKWMVFTDFFLIYFRVGRLCMIVKLLEKKMRVNYCVTEVWLYKQECFLLLCLLLTSPIHDMWAFGLVLQKLKNSSLCKMSL